ncbi:MAG: energy-coupling factor transporter transmembrane component T [Candidatus Nanoarchaeia archaeon]
MARVILLSYMYKNSFFHKLNPLTKLLITTCVIILTFILRNFIHNLILFALFLPVAYYSKVLSKVFKPLKYLFIIFVILFGIQSFFYPFGQTVLVELPFGFHIWLEGILYAADVSARLLVMMICGYWFVLTTHPGDLVSALRKIGIPHAFGYIIITTLQLIPKVQSQMEVIIDAQKSRGLETQGSVINKLKAYTPLLGPLFMGSVQQVVERSMALEARAFSADCPKTSFRKTSIKRVDKIIMVSVVIASITGGVLSWVL